LPISNTLNGLIIFSGGRDSKDKFFIWLVEEDPRFFSFIYLSLSQTKIRLELILE
jgi:hypothetical protein